MIKQFSILWLIVFCGFFTKAQNSYVYIEGIKGIPFNVLSDNKEVPKLGKSYTIITYAEPGEKTIDITFVNTNFSKQRFILDVQANSSYGFRMGKTEENKFYLIDLVNDGKVIETNSPVNLALSTQLNVINLFKESPATIDDAQKKQSDDENAGNEEKVSKRKKKHTTEIAIEDTLAQTEINNSKAAIADADTVVRIKRNRRKKMEQKIDNASDSTKKSADVKYGVVEELPTRMSSSELKGKTGSEHKLETPAAKVNKNVCAKIASDEEIKSINSKLLEKEDDEAKLLLIKKKVVSGCFTSKQVFEMAQHFDTQYGRYSLVKFVYPLTSDQSGLIILDSLFKYETYKLKLKKLVEN